MHISDGIIPLPYCLGAYAVSGLLAGRLGNRVDPAEIPRMGLLAAAAFLASSVHIPVAGATIHLGLYGLMGIILGRRAFPTLFVTLLLQALVFQHGGIVSLGVNALNMGSGALAAWAVWRLPSGPPAARAFVAGFIGVFLPALMLASEFAAAGYGRGFYVIAAAYAVAAAIEGAATAVAASFLAKTKAGMLLERSPA